MQISERCLGETKTIGQFIYSKKFRTRNGEHITNFALKNNLSV